MNLNNMGVSIIIVHYKVKEKLFECIDSIYSSKPKNSFEIIVVDNDEIKTIEKDLKKKFPKVRYIKSNENVGYGAGNNLGAKNASGKYLFFLNPDIRIAGNSIDVLYKFLEKNKKAGIVSPLILGSDKKPLDRQGYKELNLLNGIFTFSFLRRKFPQFSVASYYSFSDWVKEPIKKVDTVYGAALMISSKLFKEVGGFDERFFLYFEENDLSKRVRDLGYELYINSNSKIIHHVGQSTKQTKERDKIFAKSRFLYFKKHFGIIQALLLESLLKINKVTLFLTLVLALALGLRLYNLSNGMVFIGDQGWFYLSARNLLIYGNIPLVGITSSHTWLHQGPLWTYMLSIALFLFNFNPLSGAYLTILFGLGTIYLMYKVGSILLSQRAGLIAALLYAFSPLPAFYDRMPFDPTPIPFFTILYFYVLAKWVRGNINHFPFILLLIAVLYNLELSTFILFFPFMLIIIYGLFTKKYWAIGIFNKKTFIYSLLGALFPMLPVIIYDFSHGFPQTIIFLGWTVYKPFSFLVKHSSGNLTSNFYPVLNFLAVNIQNLVLENGYFIGPLLFVLSMALLFYITVIKNKFRIENPNSTLLFLLLFSLFGILVNQTPSGAYLFILFPLVVFCIALFFDFLIDIKRMKYFVILLLIIISMSNIVSIYKNDHIPEFKNRLKAASEIISLSGNKEYNLIGKGEGSQFRSFTMNYEYLLWWKGYPVSANPVKTKIIVWETGKGITVYKL